MSLNPKKLNVVEVRDPRTVLTNERDYAIMKSGSQTTWKQYTSTSISQSAIQFSCPPPSGSVIVDRKQYFYLPARLTFTGKPLNGTTLLQPGRDAPRAFPISGSIDTYNVSINNQSVSVNLADVIHPLMHYNTDAKLKTHEYSLTPSCLDQSQQYSDLFGTIRNPLGGYGDSNDESVQGRGGFPYVIIANPVGNGTDNVTAIIDIAVCEPIFLSPFYWGHSNSGGFYNVNTMDFNITFLGGNYCANRWWSRDNNGIPLTASTITWGSLNGGPESFKNNQPTMLFQYITPQDTQMLSPNMSITYPYFDIQRYPTDLLSSVGAGVSTVLNSNNLQLSSIPRRLYVYVRQRNSDLFSSPTHTDTYFRIDQISIQFLNKNGLLSSASAQQLYNMSVSNHCNMSWSQFHGSNLSKVGVPTASNLQISGVGSILCIEFAKDIGLDALDAPGKLLQCMLQIQVNCTNISSSTITPTLYVVPILEGTFTIERLGQSTTNIGVITSQDILDARHKPGVNYKDAEDVNGGDFLSGLKDFFSKAHNFVKDNKLISNVMGAVPFTAPFAGIPRALGYGEGGVLVGGQQMSKQQLRRRLMN